MEEQPAWEICAFLNVQKHVNMETGNVKQGKIYTVETATDQLSNLNPLCVLMIVLCTT